MKKKIDKYEFSKRSEMNDSFGRVFTANNKIYRGIAKESQQACKELLASGLIDELVSNDLFPATDITDFIIDDYGLVIEHKKIQNLNFPYEWTFNMYKESAKCLLKINRIAYKYGYMTKDAHGYNFIFDGCKAKFIDLGSFVKLEINNSNWVAFSEYLSFYVYMLTYWSKGSRFVTRKLLNSSNQFLSYEDFVSLKHGSKWMKLNKFIRKIKRVINFIFRRTIDKIIFIEEASVFSLRNIDALIKKLEGIKLAETINTRWASYQSEYQVRDKDFKDERFEYVLDKIKAMKVKSMTELAANMGSFSCFVADNTDIEKIVAIDYDENAVDQMFLLYKEDKLCQNKILPIVKDIMCPEINHVEYPSEFSSAEGRFKSDLVVALAVTHHLLLSQNRELYVVLETIKKYTRRYCIIEFMPLGLWDGVHDTPEIPEWYTLEWFREGFRKHFRLIDEKKISDNRIVFVGEMIDG